MHVEVTAGKEVSVYLINAANRHECCSKCKNHTRDTKHPEDGVGGWEVWICKRDAYPAFVKRWHGINTYKCSEFSLKDKTEL